MILPLAVWLGPADDGRQALLKRHYSMIERFRRRATGSFLAVLVALGVPLVAHGATINMVLSDVDVTYFGDASNNAGSIFDTIGQPGGNLNPAEADVVEAVTFEVDTTHRGTLMNSPGSALYGDMRINGVGATLPLNTLLTNRGSNGNVFGFDWFTQSGNNLRLGINAVDVLLSNNVFFFNGTATILSQNLPFGLAFAPGQPVAFSYTATLPSLNGANPTQSAMGSGALTISGELIPEPGTIGLLVLGAVIVGGAVLPRYRLATIQS
jgi:hypothetical protein